MPITTYSDLQASIASRLGRDDLSGLIPDFIHLAETRISRSLRVSGLEKRATTNCVASQAYYEMPADFVATRSIYLQGDPVRTLEYMTPDVANKTFSSASTGKPYGYSLIGGELCLFPTPDSDYTIEQIYFSKPTILSDANTSNWYLANVPDLLLAGSMFYASRHTKNEPEAAYWVSEYQEALQNIINADQGDKWSGSNMRVRAL